MPLLLPFSHWRGCVSISFSPFKAHDHVDRIIATALRESERFSGRFFVCAIAPSEMATVIGSARGRGRGAITQQRPQYKV